MRTSHITGCRRVVRDRNLLRVRDPVDRLRGVQRGVTNLVLRVILPTRRGVTTEVRGGRV